MNHIAWWPTAAVLLTASVIDVRTRRIPNWLSMPFLAAGFAVRVFTCGVAGAEQSVAGIAIAAAAFGLLFYLRAMGMGDLKLAAGVGAWIGPGQLVFALTVSAMAGGVLAIGYAVCHGAFGRSAARTGDLLVHLCRSGPRPHVSIGLDRPGSLSIPYAPAIAAGTLLSFFAW